MPSLKPVLCTSVLPLSPQQRPPPTTLSLTYAGPPQSPRPSSSGLCVPDAPGSEKRKEAPPPPFRLLEPPPPSPPRSSHSSPRAGRRPAPTALNPASRLRRPEGWESLPRPGAGAPARPHRHRRGSCCSPRPGARTGACAPANQRTGRVLAPARTRHAELEAVAANRLTSQTWARVGPRTRDLRVEGRGAGGGLGWVGLPLLL